MNFGLLPQSDDARDYSLGAVVKLAPLNTLPSIFTRDPLSIKNQLKDRLNDFCAAASAAGEAEPREEAQLFYPFLFAAAKYESGKDPDTWGLELREIGKAFTKHGCPEVGDVPEEVRNLPPEQLRRFDSYPDEVKRKALKHKQATYFFVKGWGEPFDLARQAMYAMKEKKLHVIFGVEWGWPLSDFELTGTPEGYGHAMWMNGWMDDKNYAVNSVGLEGGRNGIHVIPRDTFNTYARRYGMLMFTDITREEAEWYLENGIRKGDNWLVQFLKALFSIFR